MKGLLILADGFEDSEALVTRDVLIRSGLDIITCSIYNRLEVTSSFGLRISANVTIDTVSINEYDFLVIPGGSLGVKNITLSFLASELIKSFIEANKHIFAICAAPSILEKLGVFNNKKFTCYPGCNLGISSLYQSDEEVVVEDKIITARSMYYSCDFALSIIEKLLGKEKRNQVEIGIKGLARK